MKIFNAVLLVGLFAAAVAQVAPCADLNIKHLKVVDSETEDRDFLKLTATLQVLNPAGGDISVEDLIETDIEVKLYRNLPGAANLLETELFDADECTLRGNGKSAVCKEEYNRLMISEVSDPAHSIFILKQYTSSNPFPASPSSPSCTCLSRQIKAPKDLFDEAADSTYTYFKLSIVIRKVDFTDELSENLVITIEVPSCVVAQTMDCELKEFNSRDQAICKKNVEP